MAARVERPHQASNVLPRLLPSGRDWATLQEALPEDLREPEKIRLHLDETLKC